MLWALCSSSDEEQDDVLEGMSDGGSTATSLPNDGALEESTTPNAPAQSHKGLLYCQVTAERRPSGLHAYSHAQAVQHSRACWDIAGSHK